MSERELTEAVRGKALERLMNLRRAEFYLRQMEFRKLAAGDYGAMTTAALRAAERLLLERSRELRVRGIVAVDDYPTPQFLAGAEEGLREITHEALVRADYKAVDALIPALVRVADDQAERESLEESDEGEPDTVDLDEVDEVDEAEEEPPPQEEPEVSVDMDRQEIHVAPADPGRIDLPAPPPIPAPAVAHEQPPLRTAVGPASVPGLIRNAPPPTR